MLSPVTLGLNCLDGLEMWFIPQLSLSVIVTFKINVNLSPIICNFRDIDLFFKFYAPINQKI